jgi:hypothetical protein
VVIVRFRCAQIKVWDTQPTSLDEQGSGGIWGKAVT